MYMCTHIVRRSKHEQIFINLAFFKCTFAISFLLMSNISVGTLHFTIVIYQIEMINAILKKHPHFPYVRELTLQTHCTHEESCSSVWLSY